MLRAGRGELVVEQSQRLLGVILLCLQSPRKEELNEVCDGLSQTLSLTP